MSVFFWGAEFYLSAQRTTIFASVQNATQNIHDFALLSLSIVKWILLVISLFFKSTPKPPGCSSATATWSQIWEYFCFCLLPLLKVSWVVLHICKSCHVFLCKWRYILSLLECTQALNSAPTSQCEKPVTVVGIFGMCMVSARYSMHS